ncbi:MAG: Sua5 YciO YrdC YwlC family protein [Proteobacteria bacterium]|nr:MAG: Sua5 YciO YrdC YwlC family protein [Pseudomonadota bacterium]
MAKIFLAQTDTTVGFLSKDKGALNKIKNRPLNTPCIKAIASLNELKNHARVPNKHKNKIRKAKKTTFIYPNKQSLRVIKTSPHKEFILDHKWLYTTSANLTGKDFDENYARNIADEVIENEGGFLQAKASDIFLLSREKMGKIRV